MAEAGRSTHARQRSAKAGRHLSRQALTLMRVSKRAAVPSGHVAPPLRIQAPKTGARVLLTTTASLEQVPHVDLSLGLSGSSCHRSDGGGGDKDDNDGNGGDGDGDSIVQGISEAVHATPPPRSFFALASGADALQRAINEPDVANLQAVLPVTVVVPPNSLILFRSELVHVGAGAADDVGRAHKAAAEVTHNRSVRLHMSLQHEGDPLYDESRRR